MLAYILVQRNRKRGRGGGSTLQEPLLSGQKSKTDTDSIVVEMSQLSAAAAASADGRNANNDTVCITPTGGTRLPQMQREEEEEKEEEDPEAAAERAAAEEAATAVAIEMYGGRQSGTVDRLRGNRPSRIQFEEMD